MYNNEIKETARLIAMDVKARVVDMLNISQEDRDAIMAGNKEELLSEIVDPKSFDALSAVLEENIREQLKTKKEITFTTDPISDFFSGRMRHIGSIKVEDMVGKLKKNGMNYSQMLDAIASVQKELKSMNDVEAKKKAIEKLRQPTIDGRTIPTTIRACGLPDKSTKDDFVEAKFKVDKDSKVLCETKRVFLTEKGRVEVPLIDLYAKYMNTNPSAEEITK